MLSTEPTHNSDTLNVLERRGPGSHETPHFAVGHGKQKVGPPGGGEGDTPLPPVPQIHPSPHSSHLLSILKYF